MNKSHESRIRAVRSAPRNSTQLERLLRVKSRALERAEIHQDEDRCMTELSVLRYILKILRRLEAGESIDERMILNNLALWSVRRTLLHPAYWSHRSEVAQPLFSKLEFIFFLAWFEVSLHH
jgi:hypothetical protein